MLKMVLDGERPKSNNEFWSGSRKQSRIRSKHARVVHELVKIESINQLGAGFSIDDYPLFAIFVFHCYWHKMDWTNVLVKPYEDGLVNAGILAEDNPDHVIGGATFVVTGAEENSLEVIYCKPQEAPAVIQHIVTKYFSGP